MTSKAAADRAADVESEQRTGTFVDPRLAQTVVDVVTLLSMIIGKAVDEGLIGANPCRRLRLNTGGAVERAALRGLSRCRCWLSACPCRMVCW